MRIVVVLTYPAYYTVPQLDRWLQWVNRDRLMPAILADMGAEVEFWTVAQTSQTIMSDIPGVTSYPIRLFAKTDGKHPRNHVSAEMVEAAREDPADLFVLIGNNGGAAFQLFDKVFKPMSRRFAVVIGGGYWSRIMPHASLILAETPTQREALIHPGIRFWRKAIDRDRIVLLPQMIDTELFQPVPQSRDYDLIAVSRLVPIKSFDEIGKLSAAHRVAVAGDGPRMAELRGKYPAIDWLGHVPHHALPQVLGRARLYFHAGRREYFPRAMLEAMACGLPAVAFDDLFDTYVVPENCGILVNDGNYQQQVAALLTDDDRIEQMGIAARGHVVGAHGMTPDPSAYQALLRTADA